MHSINDLAPEILASILERVVDPSEWTLDRLCTLALVSRYFLSVVASMPSLWAVARFGGPFSSRLEHIDLALWKSKEAPLVVILEHDTTMTGTDVSTFMMKVVRHSRRWRVASFHSQHTRLINRHLTNLNVPMLESFAYNQEIGGQYESRVSTLGGMNMRHLTLTRIGAMMGSTAQLCGLRTLSLNGFTPQFEVTSDEIVAAIGHFPLLEKLSVTGLNTIGGHGPSPASLSTIVLRNLHTLELNCVASTLLIALMHIEAEHLTSLHITSPSAESSLILLQLSVENGTTIGRFLSSAHFLNGSDGILIYETIDLMIMDKPQTIGPVVSFNLILCGILLSAACDYLSVILPRLSLHLTIARDTTYPLQILGRTQSITSLTIMDGSGRNILAYLAEPPDTDCNGLPHWRCPRLKLLRLSDSAYDGSAYILGDFLRKRYKYLDFAELDNEDVGRGELEHLVTLSGRVPTRSAILLLTQHGLPGIHVRVEAVYKEMDIFMTKTSPRPVSTMSECWDEVEAVYKEIYIFIAKIARVLRLTTSQCWVIVELSAFIVSMLAFAAVIFLRQ